MIRKLKRTLLNKTFIKEVVLPVGLVLLASYLFVQKKYNQILTNKYKDITITDSTQYAFRTFKDLDFKNDNEFKSYFNDFWYNKFMSQNLRKPELQSLYTISLISQKSLQFQNISIQFSPIIFDKNSTKILLGRLKIQHVSKRNVDQYGGQIWETILEKNAKNKIELQIQDKKKEQIITENYDKNDKNSSISILTQQYYNLIPSNYSDSIKEIIYAELKQFKPTNPSHKPIIQKIINALDQGDFQVIFSQIYTILLTFGQIKSQNQLIKFYEISNNSNPNTISYLESQQITYQLINEEKAQWDKGIVMSLFQNSTDQVLTLHEAQYQLLKLKKENLV